jgi:hypothetical protein
MAALDIAVMITGVALVGGGVIFWHRASRTEQSEPDDTGELRRCSIHWKSKTNGSTTDLIRGA